MNLKKMIFRIFIKITRSPSKRARLIRSYMGVTMGVGCEIYDNVSFGSEPYLISIGNNVRITKGVNLITHDGGVWVLRNSGIAPNSDIFGRIIIGNNVHIGINAIILPGITIGDNVIVGVGAIVTKDVPSNCVVAGVPARIVRTLEDYFEKNKINIDYSKNLNYKEKEIYLMNKFNFTNRRGIEE